MELGGIITTGSAALRAPVRAAATPTDADAHALLASTRRIADAATSPEDARSGVGPVDARGAVDELVPAMPRGFFDRPIAAVTTADWELLKRALAADPHGAILPGPRTAFEAPDLRLVVDSFLLASEESARHAERYFGAWRAAAAGPEAIRHETRALLNRPPGELTADDWRRLANLVDADVTGSITGVAPMPRREFEGLRQTIIDMAFNGRTLHEPTVDLQFRRWARDHDPAYADRFEDAVDAAVAGRWSREQFLTLRAEIDRGEQLVELLPNRTPAERRQVVFVMTDKHLHATAGWMQRHDPEYEALLHAAVDATTDGTSTLLQRILLSTASGRIDEFVAGRPFEQQQLIADAVLRGAARNDWSRANDPGWARKLDDALDAYFAGTADWQVKTLLRDEGVHLDAVLARRPYEQQLAYRTNTLRTQELVAWIRQHAPDWEAQVAGARDAAVAGSPLSELDRRFLATHVAEGGFDELIAGRPFAEQDRIARAALDATAHDDWNLANDPANRARVAAAIQRVIEGQPRMEEDGIIFVQETGRIDQLTAGHPFEVQERIARAVLGEKSLQFARWMERNNPDRGAQLRAAADAVAAGTHTREQFAALLNIGTDIGAVLEGRSLPDRIRILSVIGRDSIALDSWRTMLEPELIPAMRRAAAEAAHGELSDDARVILRGATGQIEELTTAADYPTQLRIADAVFVEPAHLQAWKADADPDRVARVTASVEAIADGSGTPHDLRVLRGERDVLGLVRDRPYDQQLRVATVALDGSSLVMWTRANDPEYSARLVAAIDAAASGTSAPEAVELLAADRANTFRLLAERPPETQIAVAAAILGAQGPSVNGALGAMRELALDAHGRLQALPEVPELAALRASTNELLERNIRRMTGFLPNDPNPGYGTHPDYAELGRVQSNLELLEAIAAGRTTSASAQELIAW